MTKNKNRELSGGITIKYVRLKPFSKYTSAIVARKQGILLVLWFLATILLTGLAGTVLFQPNIISGPIATIIALGMDPLRSQFTASLIMTAGATLIGAALARGKFASMIGGGIVLWFG